MQIIRRLIVRQDMKNKFVSINLNNMKVVSQVKGHWPSFHKLKETFLPIGFPSSVHHNYVPYSKWLFVYNILGSMCSVLSTQSLLFAVGLSSGVIPLAASLNWVIKDGLGQLGGVLYVSGMGHLFDTETKKLRFQAACIMKLAAFIELLTPLMPSLFLPIASISNIAKNISWLASSATRAQIHNTFALNNNLGDVTGKSGSQNTAAGLIGTGIGVILSTFLHGDTTNMILAFLPIASLSIYANYRSSSFIISDVLNHQRAEILFLSFLSNQSIPTPTIVSTQEVFVNRFKSKYKIFIEPSIASLIYQLDINSEELSIPFGQENLMDEEKYYILPKSGSLYLWFSQDAEVIDILKGLFHCYYVSYHSDHISNNEIQQSHDTVTDLFPLFLTKIQDAGWNSMDTYIANRRRRIDINKTK